MLFLVFFLIPTGILYILSKTFSIFYVPANLLNYTQKEQFICRNLLI